MTTAAPSHEEPVYRSLAIESALSPMAALPKAGVPMTKPSVGMADVKTAPGLSIPSLPMPLIGYPVSFTSRFVNDEPAAVVQRMQATLQGYGCAIEQVSANELCCVRKNDCASVKFTITLWDCSAEPEAPGRFLVELERVQGCPFLYKETMCQAFPHGGGGSSQPPAVPRQFRCLAVPDSMCNDNILSECMESALKQCTASSDDGIKLQSVTALANLCCKDKLLREQLSKVHGQERIAPLLADADMDVRFQAERLMSSYAL